MRPQIDGSAVREEQAQMSEPMRRHGPGQSRRECRHQTQPLARSQARASAASIGGDEQTQAAPGARRPRRRPDALEAARRSRDSQWAPTKFAWARSARELRLRRAGRGLAFLEGPHDSLRGRCRRWKLRLGLLGGFGGIRSGRLCGRCLSDVVGARGHGGALALGGALCTHDWLGTGTILAGNGLGSRGFAL